MFIFFQLTMAWLRIDSKEVIKMWAPWEQERYSDVQAALKYLKE